MGLTPRLDRIDSNYVINGNFDFWQRGTSFTNPAVNAYAADRFQSIRVGTMAFNILQSTDVPSPNISTFSYHLDVTTAQATMTTNDVVFIRTNLENRMVQSLYGKNITISFWVKSPKNGLHYICLRNGLNTFSKSIPYTVTTADAWQQITINTALENNITYSAGGNANGLQILWPLAAGSASLTASNNIWVAGPLSAGAGQQNLVDNTANNFRLSRVMLIEGTLSSPDFALAGRNGAEEFQLCQRYYRDFPHMKGMVISSTNISIYETLQTEMRAAPTVSVGGISSLLNAQNGLDNATQSSASLTAVATGANQVILNAGNFAGLTVGRPIAVGVPVNNGTSIRLDAEL